jgi:hypothetical protein
MSRALNFSCFRSLAACRTPCKPWDTPLSLCVQDVCDSRVFSLVRSLSFPISAADGPALFGWFTGSTERSDSSDPFARVVRLLPSPADWSGASVQPDLRSPGSRACSFSACPGSTTTRDQSTARVSADDRVAFPFCVQGRRPDLVLRSSIPGPPMPLSTLRPPPRDDARKTRGQDGSLLLSCGTLSFPATCRFIPAHTQTTSFKSQN